MNIGELEKGEFCFYVDKGFDHEVIRTYFLQRHPTKESEISSDGKSRIIVPMLCHEMIHNNRVYKSKDTLPDEMRIDARYSITKIIV